MLRPNPDKAEESDLAFTLWAEGLKRKEMGVFDKREERDIRALSVGLSRRSAMRDGDC